MAVTDPVADFLTRIRNALNAEHDHADIPMSRLKLELARILREQGYIADFSTEPARVGESIRIQLKYTDDRKAVITGLERVSRPGRRTYVGAREIPKVLGGMGTAILSTSSGVMTGHDARRRGVGGEVLAYVW
jgi:small subunit ribosomal protein S8